MRYSPFLCAGLFLAAAAQAQPAPKNDSIETVTVTASKFHYGVTPAAIAHDFVRTFAAPTSLRDAIARWQVPICPGFTGIDPPHAAVMEAHFRNIAAQAGARLKDKGCKPNIWVVLTPEPQTYLDGLHAKTVEALGYRGKTIISQPVQAWYVTGTQDIRGQIVLDEDSDFELSAVNSGETRSVGTTPSFNVGGWRAHPDLSSNLLYVTIIIDYEKIKPFLVGEVADYVAMLALSRTEDYGDCQLVPSITNLLSPSCDEKLKPDAITAADIAYLRGVYRMDAGATLKIQQDQIAGEMAKALGGGK